MRPGKNNNTLPRLRSTTHYLICLKKIIKYTQHDAVQKRPSWQNHFPSGKAAQRKLQYLSVSCYTIYFLAISQLQLTYLQRKDDQSMPVWLNNCTITTALVLHCTMSWCRRLMTNIHGPRLNACHVPERHITAATEHHGVKSLSSYFKVLSGHQPHNKSNRWPQRKSH